MIDFCYDGVSHKYFSVNNFGAKEISKPDKHSVVFDHCSFKKAIKYVRDNCFYFIWIKSVSKGNRYTNGFRPNLFYGKLFSFLLRGQMDTGDKTERPDLSQES